MISPILLLLLGALIGIVPSIFANMVTGPILSLTSRHRIIAALSKEVARFV